MSARPHLIRAFGWLGVACGLAAFTLLAQPATDKAPAADNEDYSGQALFKTYCSSCHGLRAEGDGPLADQLRVRPPDLTQLAMRLGNNFTPEKVARIIDGRDPLRGHGGPDMPVWGDAFKSSRDGYSEAAVKAKIKALVEFIQEVQQQRS
jgi:mono/diheme cytochrome c family protein